MRRFICIDDFTTVKRLIKLASNPNISLIFDC